MPYDAHPNAVANKLFAERIYSYLSQHLNLVNK